jgi:O-antigen/teichoic acid export membrane protein
MDTRVGRNFLTLGAGEALARVVAFAGGVYLARTLGPDLYGVVVLATTVIIYGARISDCGVDLLGVADVARDRQNVGALLANRLGARLVVALVLVVALIAGGLLFAPQPDGDLIAIYGFTLLPIALGSAWALLGQERPEVVAGSRVATECVAVFLVVVLVRQAGDVHRAPLAQLVGEGVGAWLLLRALPSTRVRLRELLQTGPVLTLYRRSWQVVVHALFGLMIFNADFFFLRALRDSATVGYYAAAYALVSFFLNVGRTYSLALLPVLAGASGNPSRQAQLFHAALAQVIAAALPVAIGGTIVADRLIPSVFGTEYLPAVLPLQILCWTIPVAMIRGVLQSVLIAGGRQDQLLMTTTWAVVVNLVLNLVFIVPWGMAGAAIATLCSVLLRVTLMAVCIRRGGLALPAARRFWRPLLAGSGMAVIVVSASMPALWLSIALGAISYTAALTALGGLRLRRGALPELTG